MDLWSIDRNFRSFGRKFEIVPGFSTMSKLIDRALVAVESILTFGTLNPHSIYECRIDAGKIGPFYCRINRGNNSNLRRVHGKYEEPVMELLAEELSSDSIFFEVGADNGYFSMAAAQVAEEVYAFDMRRSAIQKVEEAVEKNGYDNLHTVHGTVGENVNLDEYPKPDLLLVDIEGWEYEALKNAPKLLESNAIIIIEVHVPGEGPHQQKIHSENDVDGLLSLLENAGYDVFELYARAPWNYHIVGRPTNHNEEPD